MGEETAKCFHGGACVLRVVHVFCGWRMCFAGVAGQLQVAHEHMRTAEQDFSKTKAMLKRSCVRDGALVCVHMREATIRMREASVPILIHTQHSALHNRWNLRYTFIFNLCYTSISIGMYAIHTFSYSIACFR
jgi:hypothetical protein